MRPSQFHHKRLIDAGVQILGYPQMLHAKAFIADGEQVLVGTCNLEAWSLKRFFEIDIGFVSRELAAQFDEKFLAPAEEVSSGPAAAFDAEGARACGRVRRALAAPVIGCRMLAHRRSPRSGIDERLGMTRRIRPTSVRRRVDGV